jgi:hypothetical protein
VALGADPLVAGFGRACFLTLWQDQLMGTGAEPPLIMRVVNRLIYWPLPMWVFTVAYLVLFALVIALWWLVRPISPPRSSRR